MADEITESFLQAVAGDIEKLLIEDRGNIQYAFNHIHDGIKVNIGINMDYAKEGIVVNYSLSFDLEPKPEPIEKHKVTLKRIINQAQTSIAFMADKIRKGEVSIGFPDGTRIDKDTIGKASAKQ